MKGETIDLDVDLADGDATVTVRITAWPTRPRWGWDGGDPGSAGEWEIEDIEWAECPHCDGKPSTTWPCILCDEGNPLPDVGKWLDWNELEPADIERIDRAVAEHLAGDR